MTHTLHRSGDRESLRKDFVWLMYQTKGVNDSNIAPKARVFIEAAEACNCINWGDVKSGSILELSPDEIKERLTDKSRLRGVFTSREDVIGFLRRIKEADLGISVVVSGLLDEVIPACAEAGLTPHTINFSLGVWGNKAVLPSEDILAVTTMCGHHMISARIVQRMVDDVLDGRISAADAGVELGRLCPCGIFNHVRAAAEIEKMVQAKRG